MIAPIIGACHRISPTTITMGDVSRNFSPTELRGWNLNDTTIHQAEHKTIIMIILGQQSGWFPSKIIIPAMSRPELIHPEFSLNRTLPSPHFTSLLLIFNTQKYTSSSVAPPPSTPPPPFRLGIAADVQIAAPRAHLVQRQGAGAAQAAGGLEVGKVGHAGSWKSQGMEDEIWKPSCDPGGWSQKKMEVMNLWWIYGKIYGSIWREIWMNLR